MPWAASNRKSQGPVLWLSHAGAAGFAAFPHSRGMTSAIVGIASAFVVGKEEPVAPGASILSEKRVPPEAVPRPLRALFLLRECPPLALRPGIACSAPSLVLGGPPRTLLWEHFRRL